MDGINANTTLLGAITIGIYVFIGKFLWETFIRVWKTRRNNSPPSEAGGANPVVAADVKATRETVDKIKSDTSALKDRDTERAAALRGIGESNVRQETMMKTQTTSLEKLVELETEQLAEIKRRRDSNG